MYKTPTNKTPFITWGRGEEGTIKLSTQRSANIDNEDSSCINTLILLYAASLSGFKLIVSL